MEGSLIKEQAEEIYDSLERSTRKAFVASEGWLFRFKRRHGLQFWITYDEACGANTQVSNEFKASQKDLVRGYQVTLHPDF